MLWQYCVSNYTSALFNFELSIFDSVTLILIIDWKCGKRIFYTHITNREQPLYVENLEQKERRIKRDKKKKKFSLRKSIRKAFSRVDIGPSN